MSEIIVKGNRLGVRRTNIQRLENLAALAGDRAIDLRKSHSDWTFGMPICAAMWKCASARRWHDGLMKVASSYTEMADFMRNPKVDINPIFEAEAA